MNPSLEASWRRPWCQDLHSGADDGAGEVFRGSLMVPSLAIRPPHRGSWEATRGVLGVPL
ncbi:hypothetical protein [Halorhodospira halochloris]|uniref:hypothetical protein n=1 Tax=Halorhodospira halochloris TaxID=1052 RepID=UPI0013A59471|nr:hypothetical protein [Halorhodospira halochloris]